MTPFPIRRPHSARQRGSTMLVGLVMLMLLTLLAISAFNTTNVNLRMAGNLQARQQAQDAAGVAVNQKISTGAFLGDAKGIAYTVAADVNQDRTNDYDVTVTPACYAVTQIKNVELTSSAEDFKCYSDGTYSLCDNTLWDFQAQATDTATSASVTTHQGIGARVTTDSIPPACM